MHLLTYLLTYLLNKEDHVQLQFVMLKGWTAQILLKNFTSKAWKE